MSAEPQSIIHQVIRLERNLLKALSRRRTRAPKNLLNKGSSIDKGTDHTVDSRYTLENESIHQGVTLDEDERTSSFDEVEYSVSSFDTDHEEDDEGGDDQACEFYRTIDQNQFFAECFASNGRHRHIFVHFYNTDEADLCEQIDNELSILASKYIRCKFLRINGRLAPFFTAKLGVTTFPSVVAIRNGEVDGCISTFGNDEAGFLQNWMVTSGLVTKWALF